MTKTLKIEGMTCDHCKMAVTKALNAIDGAQNAEVDLDSGTATLAITGAVTDDMIRAAIEDAGYDVVGIQ